MIDWIIELDEQILQIIIALIGLSSTAIATIGGYFIWIQRVHIKKIESQSEEKSKNFDLQLKQILADNAASKRNDEHMTALIEVITKSTDAQGRLTGAIANLQHGIAESDQQMVAAIEVNTKVQELSQATLKSLDIHVLQETQTTRDQLTNIQENVQLQVKTIKSEIAGLANLIKNNHIEQRDLLSDKLQSLIPLLENIKIAVTNDIVPKAAIIETSKLE